jgi:hypothetical protein
MANIKELIQSIESPDSSFDEKLAVINEMQDTLVAMKEHEQEAIDDNVELIIEALRTIEAKVEAKLRIIPEKGEQGIQGQKGEQGDRGLDGAQGKDGKSGIDGKDGLDGKDGVSVQDAKIDFDGSLVITLSDGREINVGEVVPVDVAEKIRTVHNIQSGSGGDSQTVLDAIAALQATIATYGTMATQNANNVAITGGTINNTTIGATTPSTGVFTTVGVTTSINASGAATNIDLSIIPKGTGLVKSSASYGVTAQNTSAGGSFGSGLGFDQTATVASSYGRIQPYSLSDGLMYLDSAFSSGGFVFRTSTSLLTQFRVSHTASAVNYVQVTGGATGVTPAISFQGSDGNIGGSFVAKGSNGTFRFLTNTTLEQLRILNTASAVNYATITGSAASSGVVFSAAGTDTNIDLNLTTKGTGSFVVNTGNGIGFKVYDGSGGAAQVNYFQTRGRGTGSGPFFLTDGNDTNVSANLGTKGTGVFSFLTSGASLEQFRIAHTASAVNYVQVTGAATGSTPSISAQGSDSNAGLTIQAKGTAGVNIGNGTYFKALEVTAGGVANYIQIASKATGVAPTISALGTDTNIDLALTPKGTGNVRFGTYTGTILTPTGYVEIKDSGGTVRRLLVG